MMNYPKNTGNYSVGTACFSFVDDKRKETLGDASGFRKIAVRMYYPVDSEQIVGKQHAQILSEEKTRLVKKAFRLKTLEGKWNIGEFYEQVPISTKEKFPLVLYSHGYNSYIECNNCLCTELASHGYIVASVGHAWESVRNEYEDGSVDVYDKTISKKMYTSMFGALRAQMKLLKKDLSKEEALEQLEQFQDKYCPFIKSRVGVWAEDLKAALLQVKQRYADNLDLSHGVGATGHSLGGCVAYYLAKYEPQITCGINIDGGLFGEYDDTVMEKPFCQIGCRENENVETRPLLHTKAPVYHVVFDRMKHIAFTDVKFFHTNKALTGTLEPEKMHRSLAACHLNFFDEYLKGKAVDFEEGLAEGAELLETINVEKRRLL